jgi:hypothetical protein
MSFLRRKRPITPVKPGASARNLVDKPKTRPGPSRSRSKDRRSPSTIVTTGRAGGYTEVTGEKSRLTAEDPVKKKAFR